jgi:hypothetical protein
MRYKRLVLGISTTSLAIVVGLGTGALPAAAAYPAGSAAGAAAPRVAASDPPDPALALAVAQWVTNGGEDDLKALAADFTALEDAANADDMSSISSSCEQLQTDVEAAQSYDPIPDQEAQHEWSTALADYARGATDCVAGAQTTNATLITKASTEITDGSTALSEVTTRLGEIAG